MDDDPSGHIPSPQQIADELIASLRGLSVNQAKTEYGVLKAGESKREAASISQNVDRLIRVSTKMSPEEFGAFARRAMARMGENLSEGGEDLERRSSELLYRAFDPMDEVLDIRYEREDGMCVSPTMTERLYEGAGVGVQTSYTTILKALKNLSLEENARLIDLGSGYGRVGLVAGLWREDLRFTGYEYVGHRVEASRASAERAGVADRVDFFEQDLAAKEFSIPSAEAYYMFDPFSAETYLHVLRQLARIGRQRAVSVVTKADARKWFLEFVADAGWMEPERVDENTLLVFRSQPA